MNLSALQAHVARALTGQTVAGDGEPPGTVLAGELLVAKRRVEAASWLPRTSRSLGPDFARRFTAHARCYRPRGWNHARDDAIAFATKVSADRGLTPATRDAARYEAALALCAVPGPWLIARHLQHDPTRADGGPGSHLWWRWSRHARLRHLGFPWG